MNLVRTITIIILVWGLLPEASAQQVRYRGQTYITVGLGMTELEAPRGRFPMRPAAEPSFALGYVWDRGQSVEVRGSYLRFETTEELPETGPVNGAPITVSLRGLPLEATYQIQPAHLQLGGVRPMVGLGATWIPLWSVWKSDVPTEGSYVSAFGGTAYMGSTVEVNDRMSFLTRGGYRYTRRSDASLVRGTRYVQGLAVKGFFVDVGVQVFF